MDHHPDGLVSRLAPIVVAIGLGVCPLLASCGDSGDSGDPGQETGETATGEDAPAPSLEYFDQCVVGEAPDAACHADKREPGSEEIALATALAERYMDVYPATEHLWDWSEAVLMFALTELHRVTGDPALRDYPRAWLTHRIEKGYDIWWSDHCPPSLTALALWLDDGDPAFEAVVQDVLTYIAEEAPRTDGGGVGHLGTLDEDQPSLWVDSLMMVGMPLLRWAEATGDDDAMAEAALQGQVFTDRLQEASGLYTHAWNWYTEQTPGLFWARGNGWVMVFLHELLRLRRVRGEADPEMEAAAAALSQALLGAQDSETGLWWGLLSHPGELYLETSAAALNVFGLARGYRYGYRGAAALPAIAAAVDGLVGALGQDDHGRPVVTGVSGPTSVGTYEDYLAVPLEDDVPFGVGAVILALVEASGLPAP